MKVLEKIVSPLGQRNLLFVAVCILGAGAVIFNLLQSDAVTSPRNHSAEQYQKPEFRDVVERIDAEFAAHWKKEVAQISQIVVNASGGVAADTTYSVAITGGATYIVTEGVEFTASRGDDTGLVRDALIAKINAGAGDPSVTASATAADKFVLTAKVAGIAFTATAQKTDTTEGNSVRRDVLTANKTRLEPAPPADELTRIRRLSLGLTGTIPALQEIRAFEEARDFYAGNQPPPNNHIQWWLSHLFEDRRTSDYLAERFARAYVGVENGPFLVYRRRRFVSWLSDQFHGNRPYDKVVRSLITAEGLWTSNPEVNFFTVTVDENDKKNKPDEVKLAVRMTRAFLGVRLDCVQCHDDRLNDRWVQKDFHQLASFFSGANMRLSGLRETGRSYEYKYRGKSQGEVPRRVPFLPELLPEKGEPRDRLAAWVTDKHNRAFARAAVNRIWALMFGRPLVDPIDEIPLKDSLKNPYPPGLETLVDDFIAHDFDLQRLIRVIAATRVFGLDSKVSEDRTPLTEKHDQHWAAFALSRLRPEQVAGSIIQAASLTAIDADSHILFRMTRVFQQGDFIKRYGDVGADEFYALGGTISQRLLMMNGKLVHERIKDDLVANAAARILATAPDDEAVVQTTYLAVLSRQPTQEEVQYFAGLLAQKGDRSRKDKQEDLYWALLNSTEFSWNH